MDEETSADRAILIDNGKIKMMGKPKEVFANSNELYEAGLEVPEVTSLINSLIEANVDLPNDIITVEEAYELIKPLIEENNNVN